MRTLITIAALVVASTIQAQPAQPAKPSGNLIQRVDPVRDGVLGKWKAGKDGISSGNARVSLLVLPYSTQKEYDLTATFTRDSGNDGVGFILSKEDAKVAWVTGRFANRLTSISSGQPYDKSPWMEWKGINGEKQHVLISVRDGGVTVFLNDEPLEAKPEWKTADLPDKELRTQHKKVIGLISYGSVCTWHSVEVSPPKTLEGISK